MCIPFIETDYYYIIEISRIVCGIGGVKLVSF